MRLRRKIEFVVGIEKLMKGDLQACVDNLKKVVLEELEFNELYIVLGSVFREKGEGGKAIHIHESLLSIGELTAELKDYVLRELYLDYKSEGQNDMALEYLSRIKDKNYFVLYETAVLKRDLKEYEEAAKFFMKHSKSVSVDMSTDVAYCYTLLADSDENLSRKIKYYGMALKEFPKCRRASFGLLNAYKTSGKPSKALEMAAVIIDKNIVRTEKGMKTLLDTFFELSSVEDFLKRVMIKIHGGIENPWMYIFAADQLKRNGDEQKAISLLSDYVDKYGVHGYVSAKYAEITNNDFLKKISDGMKGYKCSSCGKVFKEYTDKCTECLKYETLRSI